MFCQNCGHKIKEESKFCSICGVKIGEIFGEETVTNIKTETGSEGSIFSQVLRFVSIVIGVLLGYYLGLVLFIFIGALMLGAWFSKWYIQRGHINPKLINFIVYMNWVSWFIPVLGILFGFATLGFADHFPARRKKYRTLAVCGMIASIINAFIGILINL